MPPIDLDETDGIVVDYGDEFNQTRRISRRHDDPISWVGQEVHHASFGRGTVRDAMSSRQGIKLVVEFDSVGTKTVLSNYVRSAFGEGD